MPADRPLQEQLFDLLLDLEDRPAAPPDTTAVAESPAVVDPREDLFDAMVQSGTPRLEPAPISARTNALSSLQERLWLVQQLEPASTAYIIPCHLRLRGPLVTASLKEALRLLWLRHDALRTVFPIVDGQPRRILLPSDAFAVADYDFSAAASGDGWRQHYLERHSGAMALDAGPLFRVCLYRLAPDDHALLIDLHHINGDGVSLEVLREELFTLYTALREGRPPELPPVGPTYADFVAAEAARSATAAYRQELETRIQALTGAPTRIDFQFDRPLPARFAHAGDAILHEPADLALYVRAAERGKTAGLSPFMMYLAAFGSLLHLHTKQEDMLVGVPLSQRMGGGFDRTVGFLVNTGVARLDFSGRPTLREIMRRTAKSVREMLRCPNAPLEHLARALRDHRAPDRPPLIQTTFSYLKTDAPLAPGIDGLVVEPFYVLRHSAMFELTLDLIVYGNTALCGLEYSSDVWAKRSVRRMLDHFHLILAALIDRPEARLDEIDLLPEAQRAQIVAALAGEALPAPAGVVPDLLRDHALRHPDRLALVAGDVETSHGGLHGLVSLRRGQLGALGLKPGAVLALACAPGLEWTVTALAALAEGIVVLPLDPLLPAARLRYLLENSRTALLWHDDAFTIDGTKTGLPCPLVLGSAVPAAAPVSGPARARPPDTAYLLYTSGTTGQPKGVSVSHAAFAAHGLSAVRAYGLSADDRALVFAPLHFDAAWEQLFAPLLAGGAVLIRDAQLWAPDELCRRLRHCRITCADLPPQYLRELLFHLENSPGGRPESLRLVISGGEAMPSALAQAWLAGPLRHVPLINAYGPTEAVVTALCHRLDPEARIVTASGIVPIGRPLPGRVLRILDSAGREVGAGIAGELCIGGPCLADGYLGDEARTAEVFRHWLRFPGGGRWVDTGTPGAIRLCRTGDRVRLGPDDRIEFLGRIDRQIKIRGFRIEPGEIEAALSRHPAIAQALVASHDHPVHGAQLVAYCVPAAGVPPPSVGELDTWLAQWLPPHLVPAATTFVARLPVGTNGKIDLAALPAPEIRREARPAPAATADELEAKIAAIWAGVLARPDVGLNDNFFDLGGHSILLVRVHTRLQSELGVKIPLVDLFANPTVARMARRLRGETAAPVARPPRARSGDVAVIGLAGRFPGAANVDQLWANLVAGRESIRVFTPEELAAAGVPESLRSRPDYVPAHGHLEGTKLFDAGFFGYTPKEAEIIDPQQRLFLEESWHALENAGYDPQRFPGDIGVFGGMGLSTYLLYNLSPLLRDGHDADAYAISLANDKDFITTRVSYKLDLRGPSVNVNTACSTSLVAIHLAAEALLREECDLALAGGVTLQLPAIGGYVYQPGGIASPDGHCRAFADDANGTVGGSGAAVVVLKRLDQALADGDTIHAVIKGSAINNDGADKVGFTAPGVNRQRDVIRAALDRAGLSARGLQYIEAHGTGTPMGDPIEIQALAAAFAADRPEPQGCYVGSIKSSVGHLDTAAGVAGFIKAVLALEHAQIPPTLHCERPSTKIDFARTSFRVAQQLTPWPATERRRAGVSSFGMGGTNAHVILEEAPTVAAVAAEARSRPDVWCIPLSARSAKSLLALAQNLARHIDAHPALDASDLWFTLAEGRRRFPVRAVVQAASRAEAAAALRALGEADLLRTDRDGKILSGSGNPQGQSATSRPALAGAHAFARSWLIGEQLAARALMPPGPHRRIPVPGYVFDHEVYWVEARPDETSAALPKDAAPAKRPVADWFYFPSWERLPVQRAAVTSDAPVLVIHGGSAAETRWLEAMRAAGHAFAAFPSGAGLGEALAKFASGAALPAVCWHLAALGQHPAGPADFVRRLDALLADLRALAATPRQQPFKLLLLSPHVGSPDAPSEPAFAYLDAVAAVVPHEYGAVAARVLRVDPAANDATSLRAVRSAVSLADSGSVLALANGKLWRRTLVRLPADGSTAGTERLKDHGVYLITGGLGGIGLTLARHLARTCQARLVLISRHEPDVAQRDAIREMEAAGAEVRTAVLDIADPAAVRSLVDDACARWGRPDGVIHAAGVAGGSLVARTQLDEIERVVRAKVAGTTALAEALREREPAFVLLCSSLTASLGGPGQIAYTAGNAWMDAFAAAQSARQPGLWTSVQWDSWCEVGMAARASADAGTGARPVTATGKLLREWTISPDSYWPWGEHRIDGAATLPGTAYLEMFVQALGSSAPVALAAIALSEPMIHGGEALRQVQVRREGDELILQSDDGTRRREHARARIGRNVTVPAVEPLADIAARCPTVGLPAHSEAGFGIAIAAGPRWQLEETYRSGRDEALAIFALPAGFAGDLAEHPLHPALLDIALSYYITFVKGGTGVLPWRYEQLRVFAPLPPRVVSHIRLKSQSDRALVLDVDVRDETGRLLIQVAGYTLLRADAGSARAPTRHQNTAFANPYAMTPAEGVEVFLRALAAAEPVVCVRTVDWKFAQRPVAALPSAARGGSANDQGSPSRKPRPDIAVPFREPGTEAEKRMARIWAEVLGYDRLGLDDDLFDLGADSLTALQASARLKELAGRELSMERFFAKATIAHLAADLPPELSAAAPSPPGGGVSWEEGEL